MWNSMESDVEAVAASALVVLNEKEKVEGSWRQGPTDGRKEGRKDVVVCMPTCCDR